MTALWWACDDAIGVVRIERPMIACFRDSPSEHRRYTGREGLQCREITCMDAKFGESGVGVGY